MRFVCKKKVANDFKNIKHFFLFLSIIHNFETLKLTLSFYRIAVSIQAILYIHVIKFCRQIAEKSNNLFIGFIIGIVTTSDQPKLVSNSHA